MPDEHDTLVLLVEQLQDAVGECMALYADLNQRTIVLKDYDLTNHLNRIDQTLIRVQERLNALEAKKWATRRSSLRRSTGK